MIEVRVHEGARELDRGQAEQLNLASRHASPFASPYWLEQFLAHDRDHRALAPQVMILAAWEGAALTGYLPLKRTVDRSGRKLSCLLTLEVERPQVVARPEDEARVAQAFFRYLVHRREDWDLLELTQQDPPSPLYPGPEFPLAHHWLRRVPDRQCNVLQVKFPDAEAYAAALSKKMRWNVKTQLKALFAAPGLTAMVSNRPAARAALYELFLDVEGRSWKARGSAGVGSREDTYRAVLADAAGPLELFVAILFLEGLPIGGSVWGHYARTTYYFQSAYAESHATLSPGTLMTWLPVQAALATRQARINMLPDFSYYKARWLMETIETQTVQLFRVGSRYHLKAMLGELRRRILSSAPPKKRFANPWKEAAGEPGAAAAVDRKRIDCLTQAARAAGANCLDAAALAALSPF